MLEFSQPRVQCLLASAICALVGLAWFAVPHPALAVAIGAIPLAVAFVLKQPFLMVLSFVVFSFFRLHEVVPQLYPLKIPLLLSLASMTALGWHTVVTRQVKTWWRPEFTVLAIFLALVLLGVLLASNRPIAFDYFKRIYWKIALMTFAIAWLTRSTQDFALASRIITGAGILVGLTALKNEAQGIGMVEGTRVTIGRDLGSMLGDPNDLALVLMFPAAFAIALALTRGSGWFARSLGAIAVPVLFMAVLATQSRGGLLGILAVFGVFGYQRIKSKTLLAAIGLACALILYSVAGIDDRSSGGAAEEGLDASAAGRLYAWEAAFGMAIHNPFTGVGLNNFYSNYFYYSNHWDGLPHAVHSTWFGVLAETGFLGLAVFIWLIVVLIRSAARSLGRLRKVGDAAPPALLVAAQAVLAGLIGTIVSGTFLTQGFVWPLYILTALVIAVARWVELELNGDAAKSRVQGTFAPRKPQCENTPSPLGAN